ncbi:MAG: hypothetical protein ABJA57_11790 [Ginsengibacter sp.]
MQIIKSFTQLALFILPAFAFSQSTYLMEGAKEYQLLDRLEIKQGVNSDMNFSALKPYSRKAIVRQAEFLDSTRIGYVDTATGLGNYKTKGDVNLTAIDEYNLHSLLMNNSEWVTTPQEDFVSGKPVLKSFYKTKVNMIEVNTPDFFLAVNPVFQFQAGAESNYDDRIFFNSRGVMARGMIGRKVGFSTFLTDNQERGPRFFQNQVNNFGAVPGVGFYKRFKTTGVDYFDARGYITFSAAKFIDFQFGYDKNFIGNGYRSLFLSDWGNSYLFLKINTRVWKFNYQNLFMELMPQFAKNRSDTLLDRKYAAMHHLSMNVTKWLNIGLFEGIIFGRKNHFDFQYLNPVIFLRHIEGTVGSPDNALAGIDFKANAFHKAQFYGQLMLDEFILSQITKNNGYWANKYGIQLGVKYVDAFTIKNLDLQFETNHARPYTYAHSDAVANYTHYNQPLAHPLGANFSEYIGIMKYQPAKKWYINGRLIYFTQGLDTAGVNFGSNPFEDYNTRPGDYGFYIGSGKEAKCLNGLLQVSYELKENLFLETSLLYRKYKIPNSSLDNNTTLVTLGVRWNMFKRDYNY